jgi:hypothetical protein
MGILVGCTKQCSGANYAARPTPEQKIYQGTPSKANHSLSTIPRFGRREISSVWTRKSEFFWNRTWNRK